MLQKFKSSSISTTNSNTCNLGLTTKNSITTSTATYPPENNMENKINKNNIIFSSYDHSPPIGANNNVEKVNRESRSESRKDYEVR